MPQVGQSSRYRSRMRVERRTETRNAMNERVDVWDLVAVVRCEVERLGASESFQGDAERSRVDAVIRTRYRTDLSSKMRGLMGSEVFMFEGVRDETGRRRELVIDASSRP